MVAFYKNGITRSVIGKANFSEKNKKMFLSLFFDFLTPKM